MPSIVLFEIKLFFGSLFINKLVVLLVLIFVLLVKIFLIGFSTKLNESALNPIKFFSSLSLVLLIFKNLSNFLFLLIEESRDLF